MDQELNDVEMAPPSVVRQAAHDFAAVLAETSQYKNFETASEQLSQDIPAQTAIEAFQAKQKSLRMLMQLNAVSPEEQAELERLHQAFMAEPSVQAYLRAQAELTALCQLAGDMISQSIGIDYGAACGASCCG